MLVGTLLLKLPWASRLPVTWLEALFTATSAVTVTGLVVVDTGTHFTFIGQLVIAILIQLGGLGIMTFAVLVLSLIGLPVSLPQKLFLKDDLNQTSIVDLMRLVKVILRVVVMLELVGAALLATIFIPDFGWAEGLWHAVFHSVSAFNNAGFGLLPDSLSRWATSPVINLTVPLLFITGGIGFSVLSELYAKRSWRAFSLHTKLMLSGSLVLILWPTLAFAILEWNNPGTLAGFASIADRLMISFFQAVTTRTAGFNTVDIGALHDSTAFMFISLMIIGGGSTSTAGGVKVTTFIVLLLATIAFFKRQRELNAFGRSLGLEEVLKVLALTVMSLLLIMTGIFIILIVNDAAFLDVAFEVTSAVGTVGLSRGLTANLEGVGQITLMTLMFLGRIGPLTLGFFLATRSVPKVHYAPSKVFLG